MTTLELVNQRCFDLNLELLEQQKMQLHGDIDGYVNKIKSEARQLIESPESGTDFFVMLQKAFELLKRQSDEISGALAGCPPRQTAEAAVSPSESMVHGKAKDEPILRDVLARVGAVENIMHSLLARTEDIATTQTNVQKKTEEMSKKQSQVDKKMNEVASKFNKIKNEQNKILSEIKGEMKKVTKKQNKLQKLTTRQQRLEKLVETLCEKQDEMENENCSKMNLLEDLNMQVVKVKTETEYIKSQGHSLQSALDKSESAVTNLSTKTNSLETVTEDLSEQVRKSLETLEIISASQEKNALTQKRDFEVLVDDKIILIETVFKKHLREVDKQSKETESKYQVLCHMLANRLQPLEQLRSVLNKSVGTQDEKKKKMLQVVVNTARIDKNDKRIFQLESQQKRFQTLMTSLQRLRT